jgi:WD40 repeat protein
MHTKNIRLFVISALIVLALAACQTPTAAPADTETAAPAPVINTDNAAELQAAYQTSEINAISSLVWSTDSSILIALSSSGAARYNGRDLVKIDTFTFNEPASVYAASPDGKTLAFSSDNTNIYLADASQTRDALSIYSPDMVGAADFAPDGSSLLTTSMDSWLVTLWDVNTGDVQTSLSGFETAAPVYSAYFGADGQHIIWVARATVQLQDISTQEMGPVLSHEDFVSSLALAPDGSQLATAAAATIDGAFVPTVFLWNPASGEVNAMLSNADPFNTVTFSADSGLLAAASGSTILIWDTATYQPVASISSDGDEISLLAFSPDGTSLASADYSGNITLWQVP